ncbi:MULTISPECIES: DMT family transporter [Limibacillus]|uniref:Drug/metabolite transporter (DMT)-like permease n=1 Tax=Limibacillus halophilus TaxID=1579333 RepID=A0A839ST71_9PROT|nr:DMT family transporter [Limibacillus halophilus]MBB3064964.1 drug/metabolite transporter (DMT)-like permease [Limibacillus halophilus]
MDQKNLQTTHAKGFALTLFGVLILTPDALLIRLIDIDPFSMVVWRGFLMSGTLMTVFIIHRKGRVLAEFRALGRYGLAVALFYAANAFCFILALHLTSVANTLVIISADTLLAALLSIIFLHERVATPTWCAILAGIAGVVIVVGGGLGDGTLLGDFFALMTALLLAGTFVLIRMRPDLNMIPATALGGFLAAMVALPFASPFAVNGTQLGMILVLGMFVLPVAFGLITLGPRSIPAPEVALLLLLETVLGPFWVWWGIGETPPTATFIGGAVILSAVGLHALWRLRKRPAGI